MKKLKQPLISIVILLYCTVKYNYNHFCIYLLSFLFYLFIYLVLVVVIIIKYNYINIIIICCCYYYIFPKYIFNLQWNIVISYFNILFPNNKIIGNSRNE